MDKLRRVSFRMPKVVGKCEGWFHCFSTEPAQEERSAAEGGGWTWIQYPIAIVEMNDGTIYCPTAGEIQFLDKVDAPDEGRESEE